MEQATELLVLLVAVVNQPNLEVENKKVVLAN